MAYGTYNFYNGTSDNGYGSYYSKEEARRIAIARATRKSCARKLPVFLAAHPEVEKWEEQLRDNKAHARNTFARDVMSNLRKYGSLSDKQMAAVKNSMQRDVERAAEWQEKRQAEKANSGPAPTGRQVVTGTVMSVKLQTRGGYSWSDEVTKLMLKLENGSRVWVSEPKGFETDSVVGDTVTLKATFKQADDDTTFAFGSRPVAV